MTPLKNEDSQLIGWAGFFVDIHAQKLVEETLKNNYELKEAQKQLIRSQKTLEEKVFELNKSNHDLEQFAYIASHDLQEPLRKIMTYSNLVKRNIHDPGHAEKYLERIEMSSGRMAQLIRDVLNYSRLTKSDNNFEPTDLRYTLQQVLLDIELTVEERKAVITVAELPTISAVSQQMYQLFYNLLNNALKFNNGHPQISVTCSELTRPEIKNMDVLHGSLDYVRISVKDNGIGFDQKYANQIFTIFKRLHAKETYAGTGIGLALCKKIVDNHHGMVQVESEVGKGTTFHIILPVE
jgi:light-regulated signal transduction histidine kinase (bacteriophytochrome)